MSKRADRLYDIGDLKNDPEALYDLAVKFSAFFECRADHQTAEIWLVLQKVSDSLWAIYRPLS